MQKEEEGLKWHDRIIPTEEPVFRHGFGETVSDIFKRTRICEKRQVEILEKFQEKMF